MENEKTKFISLCVGNGSSFGLLCVRQEDLNASKCVAVVVALGKRHKEIESERRTTRAQGV